MFKTGFRSIYPVIACFALVLSMTITGSAVYASEAKDTIELKSGDKLRGTLLTDAFTVSTPYSLVTVEKGKISEIRIIPGSANHDIIELNAGGSLEGSIEETAFSFKLDSGKVISIERGQCKKIILKGKNQ